LPTCHEAPPPTSRSKRLRQRLDEHRSIERFNRTLATEWADAEVYLSDEARAATYADWLHFHNHHRPHTGIGGLVPADRVHNVTGNYT